MVNTYNLCTICICTAIACGTCGPCIITCLVFAFLYACLESLLSEFVKIHEHQTVAWNTLWNVLALLTSCFITTLEGSTARTEHKNPKSVMCGSDAFSWVLTCHQL